MTIGGTATTIEITVMTVPVEAEARVAAKDSRTRRHTQADAASVKKEC